MLADFIASSDILVIEGIFNILTDNAPASIEYPHPAILTKTNKPNIPITIEGNDDIVSRQILIKLTIGPCFAYSAKYIPAPIPIGIVIKSDIISI